MSDTQLVVEADGGSRGNPGVAAGGAVVIDPRSGDVVSEIGAYVGIATNNVAEYTGMIAGIRAAIELGATRIHVRMDSKLVVEQMTGRWKIKHADMKVLAAKAKDLVASTPVTYEWIPRAENARADAMANESMDSRESFRRDRGAPVAHTPEAISDDTLF